MDLLPGLRGRYKPFPKARVAGTNPRIYASPYPGSVLRIGFSPEHCRVSLTPPGCSASRRKIERLRFRTPAGLAATIDRIAGSLILARMHDVFFRFRVGFESAVAIVTGKETGADAAINDALRLSGSVKTSVAWHARRLKSPATQEE